MTKNIENLYDKIEGDLLSGATTVDLAIDFSKKVAGYKRARKLFGSLG